MIWASKPPEGPRTGASICRALAPLHLPSQGKTQFFSKWSRSKCTPAATNPLTRLLACESNGPEEAALTDRPRKVEIVAKASPKHLCIYGRCRIHACFFGESWVDMLFAKWH
jgi:hypothetical protein